MRKKVNKITLALLIGALGVVYGDIGTSPLYALKEAFFGVYQLERSLSNILGALSLVFWSLMIIVTIKYVGLIMRADNHGEGGIFALLASLRQGQIQKKVLAGISVAILFGAALLYGDGVITPAISVLSAVEGLRVVMPGLSSIVLPLTIIILVGLFTIQGRGSGRVGKLFGPIMVIWFLTLIVLGLPWIIRQPEVLAAINPVWCVKFIALHGLKSFLIFGAIVLCVTGAEALYADMGHFGRRVISGSWLGLVYPALAINYFGQGARLFSSGEIVNNHLFYALAPSWAVLPLIILATVATVIASQALISGAFSLTNQAIALGVFPRLKVVHTNPNMEGQIYVPFVNWCLLAGCIVLVVGFKTSGALAAAYGIAVTGTMAVTTAAFYVLARYQWRWRLWLVLPLCLFLIMVDLIFFSSNLLKFWQGGYVPVIVGLLLFFIMHVWQWGKQWITRAYAALPGLTVDDLIRVKEKNIDYLLHRSVVVLSAQPITKASDKVSPSLDSFCQKWGVAVPKHLIFLSVISLGQPRVAKDDRYQVLTFQKDQAAGTIFSVRAYYGFMQTPNIRDVLVELKAKGEIKIPADPEKWLVLVTGERFVSRASGWLNRFRFSIFKVMSRAAKPVSSYFGLGADPQVVVEMINI